MTQSTTPVQTVRVFEAFAGIGAQHEGWMALQNDFPEDVRFQFVGISEIDPYAAASYAAAHGPVPNFGDITKINWNSVPDFDMFTWSFPCTDISSAGFQKGFSRESGTRSSLAWECIEALRIKRPRWALMENVKALCQKKFADDFKRLREEVASLGYVNFYTALNAKDYNVAQNRERVFMLSILREEGEDAPGYRFPAAVPLEKTVADYLEPLEDVDPSLFIDRERITRKIILDIMQQPQVREELLDFYHDWHTRHATPDTD